MRPKGPVSLVLGVLLVAFGVVLFCLHGGAVGLVPLLIGAPLVFLGWRGGRTAQAVFGHACIVVGCALITWGLYLLPYSKPQFSHIISRPLFWGFIALFGGICANYHAFCNCIKRRESAACAGASGCGEGGK